MGFDHFLLSESGRLRVTASGSIIQRMFSGAAF